MTHRLDQMNPQDALYATAREYPGGIEALAARMAMSATVLRNKLGRLTPTHHMTDEQFDLVLELCAGAGVPDAYRALRAKAWRHGHIAVPLPALDTKTGGELADLVMRVFKEGGDVAAAVQRAASDDELTAAEAASVEAEVEQAIAALAELKDRVRRAVKNERPALVRSAA